MWPSDIHLFGSLKEHLDDEIFATEADVKQAVTSCLQTINTVLVHEEENLDVVVGQTIRYWWCLCKCLVRTVCYLRAVCQSISWHQGIGYPTWNFLVAIPIPSLTQF
jgi:hypothetical protein